MRGSSTQRATAPCTFGRHPRSVPRNGCKLFLSTCASAKLTDPEPISPTEQPATNPAPDIAAVSRVPELPENPAWNLLDVMVILVFALFCLFVLGSLALVVVHSFPRFHGLTLEQVAQRAAVAIPIQTGALLLVIAFMVAMVRLKRGGDFFKAISWNIPHGRPFVGALAAGVALAFASDIFSVLLSRWTPKSLPIDQFFRDTNSAYLLALYGVLVGPFVEELFFRGFLYPALARRVGAETSVIVTAASFAIIHQSQLAHAWAPLTWLFIVGIVLTIVRARTRSVASCVIIHVTYNATLFGILFVATQGFRHLERLT
jgi:uncharacterized protein